MSLLLLFVCAATLVAGDVNLMNVTGPVDGFSDACISVVNQAVKCDSSIKWAGKDNKFVPDDVLKKLCTSGCTESMKTYRRRIAGACGDARFIGSDGLSYLAGYYPQVILEQYETICLKNSSVIYPQHVGSHSLKVLGMANFAISRSGMRWALTLTRNTRRSLPVSDMASLEALGPC